MLFHSFRNTWYLSCISLFVKQMLLSQIGMDSLSVYYIPGISQHLIELQYTHGIISSTFKQFLTDVDNL